MFDNDFPVNKIMQRPPDEARLFIEAQHNKNLDIKYLEQKLIWHANQEENYQKEILHFKYREERYQKELEEMEKVVDQLEHQNGKFKLEMRKIIHEKALGQVLALTGKEIN